MVLSPPVSAPRAPFFETLTHTHERFAVETDAHGRLTVLVFYRGHRCPYCRRYLTKLAEIYPKLVEKNARLAAISPEPRSTARALAKDLHLPFALLSDLDGELMRRFGTRNTFAGGRLPHPAVIIIDSIGRLRFRSIDRDFRRRTTVRTILNVIDQLNGEGPDDA